MTIPQCGKKTKHWQNPAWAKSQHQRPFSVKGGTRCQKGCEPRMESTQLTTMYWPYAREMSHQEQQLTNHIARLSLAEWKDNAIQKRHFCQSCFENYISWKAVQQERAQASTKASKRVLADKYKQASTASKSRQGKTSHKVQAPNCW